MQNPTPVRRNDTAADEFDHRDFERGMACLAWNMIAMSYSAFPERAPNPAHAAGVLLQFTDPQLLEAAETAYNVAHEKAFKPGIQTTQEVMESRKLLQAANTLFSPSISPDNKASRLRQALGAYLPGPGNKPSMQ